MRARTGRVALRVAGVVMTEAKESNGERRAQPAEQHTHLLLHRAMDEQEATEDV